jgi:hypothetical protein
MVKGGGAMARLTSKPEPASGPSIWETYTRLHGDQSEVLPQDRKRSNTTERDRKAKQDVVTPRRNVPVKRGNR